MVINGDFYGDFNDTIGQFWTRLNIHYHQYPLVESLFLDLETPIAHHSCFYSHDTPKHHIAGLILHKTIEKTPINIVGFLIRSH